MAKTKIKSDMPGTTVASDVVLAFGIATARGSLRTVRRTEKPANFRTLCPGCYDEGEVVAVEQRFSCAHDHGPYWPAECTMKGRDVDGRLVPFTGEEVAAVKAEGGDDGTLHIAVHPAEQVAHLVSRPTGIVYAFDPGGVDNGLVGMLRDLVGEPDLVFMGQLAVKGHRRVFRLVPAGHGIELVELARPEDVFDQGRREHAYPAAQLGIGLQLVEALKVDFDAEAYRSGVAGRMAEALAAKVGGTPIASVTELPHTATTSLEDALAASLAAARAVKAA